MDVDTTPVPGRNLVASALVPIVVVALLCITVTATFLSNAQDRRHADRAVCAVVRDAFTDQHDALVRYLPKDPKTTAFLDNLADGVEMSYEKCLARVG